MKKFLFATLLAGASMSLTFGAPSCGASAALTGTLAQFITGSTTLTNCDFGDKIFSNFSYSAGNLTSDQVQVTILKGSGLIYQVIFSPISGSFTSTTSIGFNVAVDTTNFPLARIIQFQDQMNSAQVPPTTFTPNASTEVASHTGFNTINLNAVTGAAETAQTNTSQVTTSQTNITYNPNGTAGQPTGQAFSFEVDIIQTSVPEPVTMSLMGIGLLAVGAFSRRFKKQ